MATYYARKGDGPGKKLASGLPGIIRSPTARTAALENAGFLGRCDLRVDPEGAKPDAHNHGNMAAFNGFEFGPDDKLTVAVVKARVAKVDVES